MSCPVQGALQDACRHAADFGEGYANGVREPKYCWEQKHDENPGIFHHRCAVDSSAGAGGCSGDGGGGGGCGLNQFQLQSAVKRATLVTPTSHMPSRQSRKIRPLAVPHIHRGMVKKAASTGLYW